MESVAVRVGIAKTTVYRRYPTKAELVRSAIRQYLGDAFGTQPNTGSLRGDLITLGMQSLQLASSVLGQGLFRTQLLDRVAPELEQIGQEFEAEREAQHKQVAARAIARGELASDIDFARLLQVLSGALLFKVAIKKQTVDELEVSHIVDMLLNGVAKPSLRPRHSP